MKEIKILIQQLRNYPNNFFVYPTKYEDLKHDPPMKPVYGLTVCDVDRQEQGFIETGGKGEVVIET